MASPAQRAFGDAKRDTLPRQCRECPVLFACRGECPKNRVAVTADGELGLNHLCAGYLHFFTHVDGLMRVMADAIRRGGFADEVMEVLAQAPVATTRARAAAVARPSTATAPERRRRVGVRRRRSRRSGTRRASS